MSFLEYEAPRKTREAVEQAALEESIKIIDDYRDDLNVALKAFFVTQRNEKYFSDATINEVEAAVNDALLKVTP